MHREGHRRGDGHGHGHGPDHGQSHDQSHEHHQHKYEFIPRPVPSTGHSSHVGQACPSILKKQKENIDQRFQDHLEEYLTWKRQKDHEEKLNLDENQEYVQVAKLLQKYFIPVIKYNYNLDESS